MTQQDKLLDILSDGKFHCTSEMYAAYMSDPRTLICKLKKKDFQFESRICQSHNYHDGNSKEWKLLHNPNDSQIVKEFRDEYKQRTENRTKQLNSRDTTQEGQGMLTLR